MNNLHDVFVQLECVQQDFRTCAANVLCVADAGGNVTEEVLNDALWGIYSYLSRLIDIDLQGLINKGYALLRKERGDNE